MQSIRRIRLRLTAWFVASTGIVLVALFVLLFMMLVRERSVELTRNLHQATDETVRTAALLGDALLAVQQMSNEDIPLFLFNRQLHSMGLDRAPREVVNVAEATLRGMPEQEFETNHQTWRAVGQPFTIRAETYVVVAVADESTLDEHYVRLLKLFALAGLPGMLLLGLSGYYFAGRAIEPIQANAQATRRFMSDAAHELRTPVTSVRAHAEVALARDHLDTETTNNLRSIVSESSRLAATVADLLTLARTDFGGLTPSEETFFLDDVVSDATASIAAQARSKQVSLSQGRYEQARITGDPRLIFQLMTILLDNALTYTPGGGAIVTDVFAEDGAAVLAVRDTGIGIELAAQPHIFDRFFRGEAARKLTGGAGLGLSIARWIAQAHRAEIKVTSAPGAGSRFEVRFPASP